MHDGIRYILGSMLAIVALGSRAAEAEAPPSPEFLEFLGTWSGADDDGDLLEFLEDVLREAEESAPSETAGAAGEDDVPR
jgi:hypothetical protein